MNELLVHEVAISIASRYRVVQAMVEASALVFGVTPEDVVGESRSKAVVEARQIVCVVARRCTRMSYPELGRELKRDHTTVMSAVKSMTKKCRQDAWLRSVVDVLVERFGAIEESATQ